MDDELKRKVLRWWQSMNLSPAELKEKGIAPAPTVFKARLKRCDSAEAVMLTEGFRALWLSLPEEVVESSNDKTIEIWATIAAVLVYVKQNSNLNLASAAGHKGDNDKSVVSELRFSQLQNAKTSQDFLRRMRRILQQVKGEVSVTALANDVHQWFMEHYRFGPRKAGKSIGIRWAMDYYRAASNKNKQTA